MHKPCGAFFGHIDPLPPSWTVLLGKWALLVKWTFHEPPSPHGCPHGLCMTPYTSWAIFVKIAKIANNLYTSYYKRIFQKFKIVLKIFLKYFLQHNSTKQTAPFNVQKMNMWEWKCEDENMGMKNTGDEGIKRWKIWGLKYRGWKCKDETVGMKCHTATD